ncbi:MAG: hypothetical protein A2855_02865 [Candidatus Liptonbacteria bacterium RIFCSPHIGHO2_01_FULL_57_28]|uniref:Uncharacterized protein n=1 Tax=Candidatus Liptonbacteria bacterium RIFCSPHIGHO2_01_FULL_57_28 TaxID=1798647 RepID=A0A1G2CA13_9BACT|nr:MAG: hypothetical protein A2855_02865 [Candidatus Liptonbacteria bacterium RIFCSPHIGHO2_01_FULL_57_28]
MHREHFRRFLLTNGAAIVGSFIVFIVIFYLFAQFLSGKVDQILANRVVIAQRASDLETLSKLKTDTAAAAEMQKKINALLPPQDNLITFPQFFNTLARNHSLAATFSFSGAPTPAAPPVPGYVDFSATVEGEAANIRLFIEALESKTTRFMVNIHGLVLSPRSGIFHVDLSGRVFFQENKSNQA